MKESPQIDIIRIERAREEFKKKLFNYSLEIYKTVENKDLFEELDKSIIEYCERNSKEEKQ